MRLVLTLVHATLALTQSFGFFLIFVASCSQAITRTNFERKSTCANAYENCENDETCRWQMSDLQMKCRPSEDCQRTQCAAAMRRLSRFVNKSLLESMMFCQCAFSDVSCKHQQGWMYPRCLYDIGRSKPNWSCSQTIKLCQHDSYCQRNLNALNQSCPLSPGPAGGCVAKDLAKCRLALINVRGTDLETPCYCEKADSHCLNYQNLALPQNPCIEDSMIDFVALGSIATANERHSLKFKTSKSAGTTRRKLKNQILKNRPKPTTTTTTSTTESTIIEISDENEIKVNKDEMELEESETGEEKSVKEIDVKLTPDNATRIAKTDLPYEQPRMAVASEVVSSVPGKRIKISKKPASSTPKIISGESLVTQTPPPKKGGCQTRNLDGEWITHFKNSVFRQYSDLSGRCSLFCECSDDDKAVCSPLSCMTEGSCKTPQTTINFGERLFIEGRGACLCHSDGEFICDSSEEVVELDPGIYISLGFSREELKMIKEKVPKQTLEKCGLVSPDISIQNDIASRLQFALERVLPKDMLCRVALIERYSRESLIMLRIQWYGVDKWSNTSNEPHWHVGKLEKICAPYVRKLEYQFLLERAARYQLVLSTVKQLRVYDLLNGLPPTSLAISKFHCSILSLILSSTLIVISQLRLREKRPQF